MKKMFRTAMIAFAALTLGLTSCNNDDAANDGLNGIDGKKATLTVRLANPSTTKATSVSADKDMNVGEYLVVVFDKNGVIITSAVQNSAEAIQNLETTTAANQLMVIGNYNSTLTVPDGLGLGGLKLDPTLTTRDKLIAALENGTNNNLAKSGAAAITGADNSVWLAGESLPFTWSDANITQSGTYFQDVPVTIRAVVAKIDLTVEVPDTYNPASGANPGNFRMTGADDGIVVLNAVSTTKFFGDKPFNGYDAADYPWLVPATKAYYSGISGYPNLPAATSTMNFLTDAFTGNGATTLHYHYYLFENDANTTGDYPTIVTLKGTWGMDLDATDTNHFDVGLTDLEKGKYKDALQPRFVYFPIQLISADAGLYLAGSDYGKGVQRGKQYNITLRLTDKVFEGEYAFPQLPIVGTIVPPVAPGVEDPSETLAEAQISVTVAVESWVPMNISKEW